MRRPYPVVWVYMELRQKSHKMAIMQERKSLTTLLHLQEKMRIAKLSQTEVTEERSQGTALQVHGYPQYPVLVGNIGIRGLLHINRPRRLAWKATQDSNQVESQPSTMVLEVELEVKPAGRLFVPPVVYLIQQIPARRRLFQVMGKSRSHKGLLFLQLPTRKLKGFQSRQATIGRALRHPTLED